MIDDARLKPALIERLKGDDDLVGGIFEGQKQWQDTLDAVKDYIFVADKDRRIRRTNISFASRFNKHPREIIGLNVDELLGIQLPVPECNPGGTSSDMKFSEEIKLDDCTYLLSVYHAKYNADEVCVCVMKDITEIIALKNKIYQSSKIASIGLLVAGVAHEINNPLTGILGFSELLKMKVKDEGIKKEVEKIHKAAERCKHIVDSLMCFSRQQETRKSLENINDAIDKILELRAYWLRNNNIEMVKEYGSIPLAYFDVQQIQRVIFNIVMNAEHAISVSGRKGKIVIHTEHESSRNKIILKISDNGAGIPENNISRVFDPFFTTKPVNEGTGLGLSISHGIVSEHGGTISVESKEGEGSVFIIELPMK